MAAGRTVLVRGSAVQVLDVGSGPAVLLLHGSGPGTTGAGSWGATAEALAGSCRLVAPDLAGFGGTPLPPGSRGGRRTWTEQASGLVDALGLDRYVVVGHSMGAAVALSLAVARPSQVAGVVAVSAMGAPGAPLSPDLEAVWAAPPGRDGARDMLSRLLLDPALVGEQAVTARAAAMEAGEAAFEGLFPPPRQRWVDDLALAPAELAGVRAPVLLVHGAQDTVTPLATSVPALLASLPDARLHVLDRCGHAPAVEHPDAFRALLADFLGVEAPPDRRQDGRPS
ncbi:alpha/beta fold hydrolase [Aquipuribacter hungaricus]|uniref:Alpha/beta fold hydrolase n=1 Tax=Aquipuribacter hungaricus TaxID=545624 RepID=A0ABV7WDY7_9MICO